LLARGALIETADSYSLYTPLLTAAVRGDLETVKLFLDAGANLEAKSTTGDTPILAVVKDSAKLKEWAPYSTKRKEVLRLLCETGASLSAKDSQGKTASYWAGKDKGELKKDLVQIMKRHRFR